MRRTGAQTARCRRPSVGSPGGRSSEAIFAQKRTKLRGGRSATLCRRSAGVCGAHFDALCAENGRGRLRKRCNGGLRRTAAAIFVVSRRTFPENSTPKCKARRGARGGVGRIAGNPLETLKHRVETPCPSFGQTHQRLLSVFVGCAEVETGLCWFPPFSVDLIRISAPPLCGDKACAHFY